MSEQPTKNTPKIELENLAVGDWVLVDQSAYGTTHIYAKQVSKILKNQILVNQTKYRRTNGLAVGFSGFHIPRIKPFDWNEYYESLLVSNLKRLKVKFEDIFRDCLYSDSPNLDREKVVAKLENVLIELFENEAE